MEFLTIPGSEVKLSRVGFGCARIFGGLESGSSSKLIEAAIDLGITHFDTAPMYGSEELLGKIFDGQKGITFTTKVGILRAEKRTFKSAYLKPFYRMTLRPILSNFPIMKSQCINFFYKPTLHKYENKIIHKRALTKDYVRRELEQSLKNLKREFIDIYLIHEPQQFEITDDTYDIFEGLKDEGLIKSYGLGGSRITGEDPVFGGIDQCRFEDGVTELNLRRTFKIFHGVLRNKNNFDSKLKMLSPYLRVKEVLESNPSSTIIFSASSPSAIRQVVVG